MISPNQAAAPYMRDVAKEEIKATGAELSAR
jgi:hypothetical protein